MLSHNTRSPKRAIHFRLIAVASITVRNGAADFFGVVRLKSATILRWLGVVRRTKLWNSVPLTVTTLPSHSFLGSGGSLGGDVGRLRAEQLSNKLPQFSPTLLGEFTACSRVTTGGRGRGHPLKSCFCWRCLVLPHRIELWTSPLPRECSTTELRQRTK